MLSNFSVKYGFSISLSGLKRAAWATLLAYLSMVIISYVLGQKHYKVPYDVFRVLLYLIVGAGLAFLVYYNFKANYYISTLVLFAFFVFIFTLERKEIKQLLKR